MKSCLNKQKETEFRTKETAFKTAKKLVVSLLVFFVLVVFPLKNALAQIPLPVIETGSVPQTITAVKDTLWKTLTKALQKAGSLAFQRVLSSALNKIAYDAANYIGSGGKGQKPLFITKSLGAYLEQIGDEAAGQFIESFVNNLNNTESTACSDQMKKCREDCSKTASGIQSSGLAGGTSSLTLCNNACDKAATACAAKNGGTTADQVTPSFNVCSPSSLEAKVKIGLGLVDQSRPQAPNCTASQMIKDWGDDINKKIASLQDKNYLDEFVNIFDPRANDVGIFITAQSDLSSKKIVDVDTKKSEFITNAGWTDVRDIAGLLKGVPGSAQKAADDASAARQQALGKTTGDILVDAANVFLNQLYISAFNNLLQNLGKTTSPGNISNGDGDPGAEAGATALKEITNTLLQPKFGVRADYDILSELSICLDAKNPGPTDCVIDTQFMQGIAEKKTVAEAIKEGYLHGDWQLTTDNRADAYSLRNISILRQYRILPVGWEEAVTKAYAYPTPKKLTLMDYISCFDSNDQYNKFSNTFNTSDQGWCQGLIDPNWVLKAPLNYCKKEGVGAQILSKQVTPGAKGVAGAPDTPSELSISRADSYCADNQTCIKEKSDGSCDAYGYCSEERRIWVFGSDSCSAINNTCQAFSNTESGSSVAYLENTLSYDNCTSENSGCRRYSFNGVYASSTNSVFWDSGQSVYLNKNVKVCDNKDSGCTELMRLKPTWGNNLVMNSNFGNDIIGATSSALALNDWPLNNAQATIVNSALNPGDSSGKALYVTTTVTSGGIYSNSAASLLPANFQTISGQSYTLSADIYLSLGDSVSLSLGAIGEGFAKTVTAKNAWQHISVTRIADSAYNDVDFFISGYSQSGPAGFYLKNLKFEISGWDTGYSAYGQFKIYEKLLPAYLEKSCYVDAVSATKDYSLKTGAPVACSGFARKCNQAEAGCELYSAAEGNFAVPAKVVSSDYCSDKCLGYDVYIAKASRFNSATAENLIPSKSTVCSAAASGCTEFTNLDTLLAGGEQKEYYTALKQCVKPAAAICAPFYSWEGTDGGYQLKSYSLKSANGLPEVTADDSAFCNAAIYNLPISDAAYNADCREFYNAAGQVSYHLNSRTITCSNDCHAYRLSDKNIVKNLTAVQCTGADKHWNVADSTCNVCLSGGVWDTNNNACVYQAIPGEGQTCSASENGCREYNGNSGNNVRLISAYDFEGVAASVWTSNCVGGLSISSIANSKNGHSLQYLDTASNCQPIGSDAGVPIAKTRLIDRILASDNVAAQLAVGRSVNQNSAYTVKFLARASADASLKIYFLNKETGARSYFNASSTLLVKGGDEWKLYQVNLDNLDHIVSLNERLIISANANFLFDDFVLSEITDRYYLLKNSSLVPNICYYDILNNYQGVDYNLGCAQYIDRGNLKHNLRQFSKLCSDSAVGCEQMIDTKNYSPYGAGIWNDANNNGVCDPTEVDCVKVSGDSALYAVYDPTKLCNAAGKGCSRFGQGQGGTIITSWTDVYKQNNPDTYAQTLCQKSSVGCEEWRSSTDNSLSYFKNPGANVCSYRASTDPTISGKAWYKIAVKRCDINDDKTISGTEKGSAICIGDADCGTHKCLIDNNDYPCSVSSLKTIGLGGAGNQVWVPDTAAGLCDANESGCTEYIDPVSRFSANLVYGENSNNPESGSPASGSPAGQIIKLQPNKLYSFATKDSSNVSLNFSYDVRPLLSNNNWGTTTKRIITNGSSSPIIFNSFNNSTSSPSSGGATNKTEIKELVIDYQLKSNVDKKSCNGLVKFDNGCILFNERDISGAAGLTTLENGWDAYKTVDGATTTLCSLSTPGSSCTANQLVKVRPDRVCSKWLDCITYIKDPLTTQRTCYAVGECDRLNDKGECVNFTSSGAGTRNFAAKDMNATGYSLINKYYFGSMREVGLNSSAHFDFEESIPALSCRRDIDFSGGSSGCVFNKNIVKDSLVREPAGAPTDYPAHGQTYLKVPATFQISPLGENSYITLEAPKTSGTTTPYYLSYMVNTKNSGLGAKVIIVDKKAPTPNAVMSDGLTGRPLIATSTANNGWETKVMRFNINKDQSEIKIYLSSDTTRPNEPGFVYFDNINIEPVLEIASGQYATRDCRLYPTEDSLTCVNKNSNTISDGLEGYCLERDSFNPGVCLLWYPVDKISTAKTAQSALGYQGTYPLNYCTEVNGNFDVVEKRVGAMLNHDNSSGKAWNTNCTPRATGGFAQNGDPVPCANCPGGSCQNYYVLGEEHGTNFRGGCFPKPERLLPGTTVERKYSDLGFNQCEGTYLDGWALYDGRATSSCSSTDPCTVFRDNVKIDNIAFGSIVQDEYLNAVPPYRVYDYNAPPVTEDDLKYVSDSDTEKVYRLTCNKFIEVVDSSGENKAWTNRVSQNTLYATATPRFFVYNSGTEKPYGPYSGPGVNYDLNRYGRNSASVPFGAATWPDNFDLLSSDRVLLRNQYSTQNGETVFAGRPYGCANGVNSLGCSRIGSCSLNPNIYCLAYNGSSTDIIAQQTCRGLGICVPLWNGNQNMALLNGLDNLEKPHYENILRTLFLKSYNSYSFVNGFYTSSETDYYQDYTVSGANTTISGADIFPQTNCVNRSGEGMSSFCPVYPTISPINLYFGDTAVPLVSTPNIGTRSWRFNLSKTGVYRLEFNSRVDAEQQPLKRISINWGDDNKQVITGQDQHPTNPHSFYHYYSSANLKDLEVTVYDNWGFYNLPN
ncbi:MAG: hypothetical protein NTY31_00455 [Candidatus Falkowbacteria bacterium]|nr:hypothetical protein [Candidatus Falkowbacteria bacterium]